MKKNVSSMLPEMTIMAPTVVNVEDSSESVALKPEKEYDYMDAVGNLLDTVCKNPEAKTDEEVISQIMDVKEMISEITSYVVKTGLFEDAKDRYIEFLDQLLEISTRNERIKQAWLHFLTKICDAPTQIHMRGVIILCLPALNYVLSLPDPNVASEGLLCRSDNRERYKDCDDYGSMFCNCECECGPKMELPMMDCNIDCGLKKS